VNKANINNRCFFVRGAIPFIIAGFIFTAISAVFGHIIVSVFFGLITCFVAFFFRDPARPISVSGKEILAPADGKIVEIRDTGDYKKVSIFMSLLNVHVNRIPVNGVIKEVVHTPGRFLRADADEASKQNEQNRGCAHSRRSYRPFSFDSSGRSHCAKDYMLGEGRRQSDCGTEIWAHLFWFKGGAFFGQKV